MLLYKIKSSEKVELLLLKMLKKTSYSTDFSLPVKLSTLSRNRK